MDQVDITLFPQDIVAMLRRVAAQHHFEFDIECACHECGKKYNPYHICIQGVFPHPISSDDADIIEGVLKYGETPLKCAECMCKELNSIEWPAPYDGVTFTPKQYQMNHERT